MADNELIILKNSSYNRKYNIDAEELMYNFRLVLNQSGASGLKQLVESSGLTYDASDSTLVASSIARYALQQTYNDISSAEEQALNIYSLKPFMGFQPITNYIEGMVIRFRPSYVITGDALPRIKIGDLNSTNFLGSDGEKITAKELSTEADVVVKYTNGTFLLVSNKQASLSLQNNVVVTKISDDINLTQESAYSLVTERAVKRYVDSHTQSDSAPISNCITSIAQIVKLEFIEDILTLKSGSTFYYPKGIVQDTKSFGIANCITNIQISAYEGESELCYVLPLIDTTSNYIISMRLVGTDKLIVSADTPSNPEDTTDTEYHWYDLNTNLIKVWTPSTSSYEPIDAGLCLGIVSTNVNNDPTYSAEIIRKVFNGFGYMGTTLFVLPNISGLIPNGRDAYGKVVNDTFTTDEVSLLTLNAGSYKLYLNGNGLTTDTNILYNIDTNYLTKETSVDGYSSLEVQSLIEFGTVSVENNAIVSYNPRYAISYTDDSYIDNKIKDVLALVYPIGSLYISTSSTNPLATLIVGSQWELVAANKALWTSDSENEIVAGTTIPAGLPNITGDVGGFNTWIAQGGTTNGAFYIDHDIRGGDVEGGGGRDYSYQANFDASRSNSIYGSSTTVQPPAYVVNVWKRVL